MFDRVLNTPLHFDGYYLHGFSNHYVYIVVRECFKDAFSVLHFVFFVLFHVDSC